MSKIILSLCDYTGNWSKPYKDAGYDVRTFDLQHNPDHDIRLIKKINEPIYGILCAPPCTAFALSGAQYWPKKDKDGSTLEGLSIVDACLRIVLVHKPRFWVLENPVGRLKDYIGDYCYTFHPYEFAGYTNSDDDRYTKKTLLWGNFNPPIKKPLEPLKTSAQGSKIQIVGGKSKNRQNFRSATPLGFALAFYQANNVGSQNLTKGTLDKLLNPC